MPDRATIRAWQAIAAAERETGITGKSSADATYAAQREHAKLWGLFRIG